MGHVFRLFQNLPDTTTMFRVNIIFEKNFELLSKPSEKLSGESFKKKIKKCYWKDLINLWKAMKISGNQSQNSLEELVNLLKNWNMFYLYLPQFILILLHYSLFFLSNHLCIFILLSLLNFRLWSTTKSTRV